MKLVISILISAMFLFAKTSVAKERCDKALDLIPKFESSKRMFKQISEFKSKYAHCMDGGIAEGISAVIVESLDKNWQQLSDIESLNKKDSTFKNFILVNIQPHVTGQEVEVTSIMGKAQNSCPKVAKAFCRELIKSSKRSLDSEQ